MSKLTLIEADILANLYSNYAHAAQSFIAAFRDNYKPAIDSALDHMQDRDEEFRNYLDSLTEEPVIQDQRNYGYCMQKVHYNDTCNRIFDRNRPRPFKHDGYIWGWCDRCIAENLREYSARMDKMEAEYKAQQERDLKS